MQQIGRRILRLAAAFTLLAALHMSVAAERIQAQGQLEFCTIWCAAQTTLNCDGDPEFCLGYFTGCMYACMLT